MGILQKTLMIAEVSQKQNYIFSSRKLKDNVERSDQIAYATSSGFFRAAADRFYNEEENLVYAGGSAFPGKYGATAATGRF